MRLLHRPASCSILVIAGLAGCAGQPESEPQAGPPPGPTLTKLKLPFSDPRLLHQPASPVEADQLVTEIERGWPPPADDPLRKPSSLDDVLQILKLDQRNLFSAAVDFAKKEDSLEAKAMVAQIELAWGESYAILMDVLLLLRNSFERTTMTLEMKRSRNAQEESDLAQLNELAVRIEHVVMLFQILNSDHTSKGAKLAAELIADNPDSYLGYRLSADHHRVMHEWDEFDAMVAKIEEINPDSNGLRFLRGAEAFQRHNDRETAADLYGDAIRKDVNFVRAQAHLVMCQENLKSMNAEFRNLRVVNPNHQLVQWLGAAMKLAYELNP